MISQYHCSIIPNTISKNRKERTKQSWIITTFTDLYKMRQFRFYWFQCLKINCYNFTSVCSFWMGPSEFKSLTICPNVCQFCDSHFEHLSNRRHLLKKGVNVHKRPFWWLIFMNMFFNIMQKFSSFDHINLYLLNALV